MIDNRLAHAIRNDKLTLSIIGVVDKIRKREGLGGLEVIEFVVKDLKSGKCDGLFEIISLIVKELCDEYSVGRDDVIEILVKALGQKYRIPKKNLRDVSEILVPVSVFSTELGGLEALVKYLKENLGLGNVEIAEELNRTPQTVWTAYNRASGKSVRRLSDEGDMKISLSVLGDRSLTIFENVVVWLRERGMRYSEIGDILNRDQRNVWTIYSRAIKKVGGKK